MTTLEKGIMEIPQTICPLGFANLNIGRSYKRVIVLFAQTGMVKLGRENIWCLKTVGLRLGAVSS